jgi:hypothetical protein
MPVIDGIGVPSIEAAFLIWCRQRIATNAHQPASGGKASEAQRVKTSRQIFPPKRSYVP